MHKRIWVDTMIFALLNLSVGSGRPQVVPSRRPPVASGGPTVKIAPLGSQDGDFCRNDRAMIFEDPTGVRVLYDPGRTIAGATDARLGDVHVMLLSHAHTDHIG